MPATISQEARILEYLKMGYPLTPIQALTLFQCFRLGARVFSLKKQGYNIETRMVKSPDGKKHYAEYWMGNEK
jgi:hypothetical protein